MKLSEILKDWPENRDCTCGLVYCECTHYVWNDAITACDREIDGEALAKILYNFYYGESKWDTAVSVYRKAYLELADEVISTMPTWLKRIKE